MNVATSFVVSVTVNVAWPCASDVDDTAVMVAWPLPSDSDTALPATGCADCAWSPNVTVIVDVPPLATAVGDAVMVEFAGVTTGAPKVTVCVVLSGTPSVVSVAE